MLMIESGNRCDKQNEEGTAVHDCFGNKTMRDVQPPCAPIVLDWELRTGQGREGPSRLRFFKDPRRL